MNGGFRQWLNYTLQHDEGMPNAHRYDINIRGIMGNRWFYSGILITYRISEDIRSLCRIRRLKPTIFALEMVAYFKDLIKKNECLGGVRQWVEIERFYEYVAKSCCT